jgi:hypothetical protein
MIDKCVFVSLETVGFSNGKTFLVRHDRSYLLWVTALQPTIRSRLIFLVWNRAPVQILCLLFYYPTGPLNHAWEFQSIQNIEKAKIEFFCSISTAATFHTRIVKRVDFVIISHGWRWWTYRIIKSSRTQLCFKIWWKYWFCMNSKHLLESVTTQVTSAEFHVHTPNEHSHIRKQGCDLANDLKRQTKFVLTRVRL